MESITQKDPLGCGVACVAKVLSMSYADAKKLFPNRTTGYLCKDLVRVFQKKGMPSSYNYIGNKQIQYEENDIVFIKRSARYPAGHYLARVGNQWMDSWINFSHSANIKDARSGYRKKLPGKAIYLIRVEK